MSSCGRPLHLPTRQCRPRVRAPEHGERGQVVDATEAIVLPEGHLLQKLTRLQVYKVFQFDFRFKFRSVLPRHRLAVQLKADVE